MNWGREIHLGLDLNEELMEGNNVDHHPTPTIKFPQAYEYAQFLSILQWSILQSFNYRCDEHASSYG